VTPPAQQSSASIRVNASPSEIFELLRNPNQHHRFDGSGMVRLQRGGDQTLGEGSSFTMNMKLGPIPYRMTNRVVEFETDRLIAWAHLGGHRWRYSLTPDGDGTLVTETFDWSTSKAPRYIERMGYPERNRKAIVETLSRLAALFESSNDGA
jgi:uncharacterized protein YndB with AHSA1/START domain